jgi:class 3 adenylate cyclase
LRDAVVRLAALAIPRRLGSAVAGRLRLIGSWKAQSGARSPGGTVCLPAAGMTSPHPSHDRRLPGLTIGSIARRPEEAQSRTRCQQGASRSGTAGLPEERFTTHDPVEVHQLDFHGTPTSGTDRKVVTVLFVDVKGSMDLSSAIELEEWWSVIDGLFELMCESVYRFGGWVASFTGDGIKAIFEGHRPPDNHARRACDAALWLRDAICAPAADLQNEHGLDLSVRVGINSGEVLTGTIGDRYGRYFTANGYPVALAKRMEALALPGRIYLSEHTAALVAGAVQLRDLGEFEVKGAQRPVGVFELVESEWRFVPAHVAGHRGFRGWPDSVKRRGTSTHVLLPGRVGRDPTRPIAPNDDRHERPGKSTASHASIPWHSDGDRQTAWITINDAGSTLRGRAGAGWPKPSVEDSTAESGRRSRR